MNNKKFLINTIIYQLINKNVRLTFIDLNFSKAFCKDCVLYKPGLLYDFPVVVLDLN